MKTIETHCNVCQRFLPAFALYRNNLCYFCKGNINSLNGNYSGDFITSRRIVENIQIGTSVTKIFIKTNHKKYNTNIGGVFETMIPDVGTDIIKYEM